MMYILSNIISAALEGDIKKGILKESKAKYVISKSLFHHLVSFLELESK